MPSHQWEVIEWNPGATVQSPVAAKWRCGRCGSEESDWREPADEMRLYRLDVNPSGKDKRGMWLTCEELIALAVHEA